LNAIWNAKDFFDMKPSDKIAVTRQTKVTIHMDRTSSRSTVQRTTYVDCAPRGAIFCTLDTKDGRYCLSFAAAELLVQRMAPSKMRADIATRLLAKIPFHLTAKTS
jgi:archaeosine-15-forming tRNA-guanine transglycosylase